MSKPANETNHCVIHHLMQLSEDTMNFACQSRRGDASAMTIFVLLVLFQKCEESDAFVHPLVMQSRQNTGAVARDYREIIHSRLASSFFDFDDDNDDDEEDDMIDPDSLGDWRDFRRNLAKVMPDDEDLQEPSSVLTSVSAENEEVLFSQSEELGEEYKNGVWAHQISTVSKAGLILTSSRSGSLYLTA